MEKEFCPKCQKQSVVVGKDAKTGDDTRWCMSCNSIIGNDTEDSALYETIPKEQTQKQPLIEVMNTIEKNFVRLHIYTLIKQAIIRRPSSYDSVNILEFYGGGWLVKHLSPLFQIYKNKVRLHSIDTNKLLWDEMMQHKSDTISPFCGTLSDFIIGFQEKNRINHIWLDYCGGWSKDKMQDVELLFMKHILSENGRLYVTILGARNAMEGSDLFREITTPAQIYALAKRYGYILKMEYNGYYVGKNGSPFLTFGFKFEKSLKNTKGFYYLQRIEKLSLHGIPYIGNTKYKFGTLIHDGSTPCFNGSEKKHTLTKINLKCVRCGADIMDRLLVATHLKKIKLCVNCMDKTGTRKTTYKRQKNNENQRVISRKSLQLVLSGLEYNERLRTCEIAKKIQISQGGVRRIMVALEIIECVGSEIITISPKLRNGKVIYGLGNRSLYYKKKDLPTNLKNVNTKTREVSYWKENENRTTRKTHCIHGHEFTPENTYNVPNTKNRICRSCQRMWAKEAKIKHKEQSSHIVHPGLYDKIEYCKNGHKYTEETRGYTNRGYLHCKVCDRENSRKYTSKNQEKIKAYHRKRYLEKKEKSNIP